MLRRRYIVTILAFITSEMGRFSDGRVKVASRMVKTIIAPLDVRSARRTRFYIGSVVSQFSVIIAMPTLGSMFMPPIERIIMRIKTMLTGRSMYVAGRMRMLRFVPVATIL